MVSAEEMKAKAESTVVRQLQRAQQQWTDDAALLAERDAEGRWHF